MLPKPSTDLSNDIAIYRASDVFSYIMNRYIETYDDFIYKDDFGKYVFTKVMSDRNIMASFYLFFTEMVNSDIITLGDQATIIVAGTFPFLNWRRHKYSEIKSEKSKKIIDHQMLMNYIMTDRSIKVDETHLCQKFNDWINECMAKPEQIDAITNISGNIKMMYNQNTSELDLINMITAMFGESRVRVGTIGDDIIKSIAELSRYVYADIDQHIMIPQKIIKECAYYLNLLFDRATEDVEGEIYDDNDKDKGEEPPEDYSV